MAQAESGGSASSGRPLALLIAAYRAFAYVGLLSIFGSILYGFRYHASAPAANFGFDLLLYAAFILPHLAMTRSWWKRTLVRNPAGSPGERRFYITFTILTWFAVLWLHRSVPGPALVLSEDWLVVGSSLRFLGTIAFLFSVLLFFQGATPAGIDGLLGVSGARTP